MATKINDSAAVAVILSHDEKSVLLVKRRDTPIWVLPGGGIDEGETPSKAAEREGWEETGVVVSASRLIGIYTPTNRLGRITYVFHCSPIEGRPAPSDEAREVRFFPVDALPEPFFHIHKYWLDDALAHHPAPLEKPLQGVTYWNFIKYFLNHPWLVGRYLLARLGLPWNSR